MTGFTVAQTTGNNITLDNGSGVGTITADFGSNAAFTEITSTISAGITTTTLNLLASGNTTSTSAGNGNTTTNLGGTNSFTTLNIGGGAQGGNQLGLNRVNVTAAAALPAGATVNFVGNNSSFANTGSTLSIANNFVINPTGSYSADAFRAFFGGTSNSDINLSGTISGNGDLVISAGPVGGAAIVTLQTANSYAGYTRINSVATGVLRLGVNNALPTGTALIFGDGSAGNNFGAFDLSGFNQTVASIQTNLAGGQAANGITNTTGATLSTLTVNNTAGTTTTYASVIGIPASLTNLAGASNNIALTMASTNTGTQILTGNNTYSGGTTIAGGRLLVNGQNGSNSGTGTGGVQVNSGGIVGGSGRIAGAVVLNNNGSLRGGDANGAGTLTINGGLTFNAGARSIYRISDGSFPSGTLGGSTVGPTDSPTSNNYIHVTAGGLAFNPLDASTFHFTVDGTGTPLALAQYNYRVGQVVGQNLSSIALSGPAVQPQFSAVGFQATDFTLTGDAAGNLYIGFTPVPEPATVLGVAAGVLGIGLLIRRRRSESLVAI